METLNALQLKNLLTIKKGAQILTMVAQTIPALKAGNPFKGTIVEKISRVNGVINWSYENAVNKAREKEGITEEFVAEKRSWGERVNGTPFVRHITKEGEKRVYVEFKVQNMIGHSYMVGGMLKDDGDINPYLRSSGASRQGVIDKVILRDYRLSSLTQITMGGVNYKVNVGAVDESSLYDALGV